MSTTPVQQGGAAPAPTAEQLKKAAAKNRMNQLKANLNAPSVLDQFKSVLAENSGPFIASIIDLYNGSTDLQECEPNSVIFEALKAAALKLPVNKSLGFAYIVAYKAVPTMIIGYKGYIQLAMRTGQYRYINTDVVYEGEYRSKNKLTGQFDISGEAISQRVVGYFAHFEILNGFSKTLYMTIEQVKDWAARYSPSSKSSYSPWQKEFDKMAMKTVLRNLLSHYGYMSVEMQTALSDDFESNEDQESGIPGPGNTTNLGFDDAVIVGNDDKPIVTDPEGKNETKPVEAVTPAANNSNASSGIQPNLNFDNKQEAGPDFK